MEINGFNELYGLIVLACKWNDFIKNDRRYGNQIRIPVIHCRDGFAMSVQAGSMMYSLPKKDLDDNYIRVEVGYPTIPEPLLFEYAEADSELYLEYEGKEIDYTKQVYPFTPVEVVNEVIKKHGGIDHLGGWE